MAETKRAVKGRRASRQLAMQGLYAWQASQTPIAQIKLDLRAKTPSAILQEDEDLAEIFNNCDKDYCFELLDEVSKNAGELDELITKFIDRELEKLNAIELTILRIGVLELKNMLDIPSKVVINEGVELAKQFGSNDGYKFVNGVLDKASKALR